MVEKKNKKKPKLTKTNEPSRETGQIKIINGAAVMLPPEEEPQAEDIAAEVQTTAQQFDDLITLQLEGRADDTFEQMQQVHDSSTEAQSNSLAAQVREENNQRAEAAKSDLAPKKIGDTIVTASTTYDDVDIDSLAVDRTPTNTTHESELNEEIDLLQAEVEQEEPKEEDLEEKVKKKKSKSSGEEAAPSTVNTLVDGAAD